MSRKLPNQRAAEIIKEFSFGDYNLKSIYKFLPENTPEDKKDTYANTLLFDALQASYIALLNQKEESIKLSEDDKAFFYEIYLHFNCSTDYLQKQYVNCSMEEKEKLEKRGCKLIKDAQEYFVKYGGYSDIDSLAIYSVMKLLEYDFTPGPYRYTYNHSNSLDIEFAVANMKQLQELNKEIQGTGSKMAKENLKLSEDDKALFFEIFLRFNCTNDYLQKQYLNCSTEEKEKLEKRGCKLIKDAQENGVKDGIYYDSDSLAIYSVMKLLDYDFTYCPYRYTYNHSNSLDIQIAVANMKQQNSPDEKRNHSKYELLR